MHDLQKFFAESAKHVDEELDRLIPSETIEPITLHKAIRWSVFGGGKRFRPILVFAVGQTFGARTGSVARTAAAIEMLHTYSLIHDDLPSMDDDDMRRGRETCHRKFGEATAILAGDALQALAFKTVSGDDNLMPETRVRLIVGLAKAASKMVEGQQMDLEAEGRQSSSKDIDQIHEGKTGAVIRFSAMAGAIIAGRTEDEIDGISNYGSHLGMLFQITDDLLDVTQTTEVLGKTAQKDVAAAKATYPSIYGADGAAKKARDLFSRIETDLNGRHRLLIELARFVLERKS
jgi:geranylgeranyl diphosphate synthase, type II